MPRTIGIVTAHYLPHLGGVERYVFNLAKELLNRGHRVVIITSHLPDTPRHEKINGLEIFRLPCYGLMQNRLPVVRPNGEFRKVTSILNSIAFTDVIINTRFYTLSIWGAKWCEKKHISPILLEHGSAHIHFQNRWISLLGELYEHILTRYIKRKCQLYAGVSKECTQWLQHFRISTNYILYNAVDEEDYRNISFSFRKELGIPKDSVVIAFVGRLIPEKGILKLIHSCQELINSKMPIYLLIAGEGELAEDVENMCNERIILLGSLPHDKVISLFSDANIYCLPTDYPEGFPTAILEAARCGCCVITTETGGTKELIIDKESGRLLRKNDSEEIQEILSDLIRNPDIAERLGNNARKKVLENFTWKKTVDVLEEMMGESK